MPINLFLPLTLNLRVFCSNICDAAASRQFYQNYKLFYDNLDFVTVFFFLFLSFLSKPFSTARLLATWFLFSPKRAENPNGLELRVTWCILNRVFGCLWKLPSACAADHLYANRSCRIKFLLTWLRHQKVIKPPTTRAIESSSLPAEESLLASVRWVTGISPNALPAADLELLNYAKPSRCRC